MRSKTTKCDQKYIKYYNSILRIDFHLAWHFWPCATSTMLRSYLTQKPLLTKAFVLAIASASCAFLIHFISSFYCVICSFDLTNSSCIISSWSVISWVSSFCRHDSVYIGSSLTSRLIMSNCYIVASTSSLLVTSCTLFSVLILVSLCSTSIYGTFFRISLH